MVNRIRVTISKFRRHKHVLMEELPSYFNDYKAIPVYVCRKCGDRLYLDAWQMRSLPINMKYNCEGKFPGEVRSWFS